MMREHRYIHLSRIMKNKKVSKNVDVIMISTDKWQKVLQTED